MAREAAERSVREKAVPADAPRPACDCDLDDGSSHWSNHEQRCSQRRWFLRHIHAEMDETAGASPEVLALWRRQEVPPERLAEAEALLRRAEGPSTAEEYTRWRKDVQEFLHMDSELQRRREGRPVYEYAACTCDIEEPGSVDPAAHALDCAFRQDWAAGIEKELRRRTAERESPDMVLRTVPPIECTCGVDAEPEFHYLDCPIKVRYEREQRQAHMEREPPSGLPRDEPVEEVPVGLRRVTRTPRPCTCGREMFMDPMAHHYTCDYRFDIQDPDCTCGAGNARVHHHDPGCVYRKTVEAITADARRRMGTSSLKLAPHPEGGLHFTVEEPPAIDALDVSRCTCDVGQSHWSNHKENCPYRRWMLRNMPPGSELPDGDYSKAAVASVCTCSTNSPFPSLHDVACAYRVREEARRGGPPISVATDMSPYEIRTHVQQALDSDLQCTCGLRFTNPAAHSKGCPIRDAFDAGKPTTTRDSEVEVGGERHQVSDVRIEPASEDPIFASLQAAHGEGYSAGWHDCAVNVGKIREDAVEAERADAFKAGVRAMQTPYRIAAVNAEALESRAVELLRTLRDDGGHVTLADDMDQVIADHDRRKSQRELQDTTLGTAGEDGPSPTRDDTHPAVPSGVFTDPDAPMFPLPAMDDDLLAGFVMGGWRLVERISRAWRALRGRG